MPVKLNASLKSYFTMPQLNFYAKIDDHGGRWSNRVQILAQWRGLVALSVAMDLVHRAMRTALHRRIAMAMEMARKGAVFFYIVDFVIIHSHG